MEVFSGKSELVQRDTSTKHEGERGSDRTKMDSAFSLEMHICARRHRKEQKLRRQWWFKLGYFLHRASKNMTHFSPCQWMQFIPLSSSWGNVGQGPVLTCLVKDRVDLSSAQFSLHELHRLLQDVTRVCNKKSITSGRGKFSSSKQRCRSLCAPTNQQPTHAVALLLNTISSAQNRQQTGLSFHCPSFLEWEPQITIKYFLMLSAPRSPIQILDAGFRLIQRWVFGPVHQNSGQQAPIRLGLGLLPTNSKWKDLPGMSWKTYAKSQVLSKEKLTSCFFGTKEGLVCSAGKWDSLFLIPTPHDITDVLLTQRNLLIVFP